MYRLLLRFGLIAAAVALAGCAMTDQLHSEVSYQNVARDPVYLGGWGVGVLTPSAPTGQESDRQVLGDALA